MRVCKCFYLNEGKVTKKAHCLLSEKTEAELRSLRFISKDATKAECLDDPPVEKVDRKMLMYYLNL